MPLKNKMIWLQILGWTGFMLQPIFLPASPGDMERSLFSGSLLKDIMANALIVAFFYLHYFFLIPHFYFGKKYVRYALSIIVSLFVILIVPSILASQLPSSKPDNPRPSVKFSGPKPSNSFSKPDFPPQPPFRTDGAQPPYRSSFSGFQAFFSDNDHVFFLFASIVCFSLLLKMSNRYYETANAKHEAEINYLLAQINPHFLFNALNSIYTLTIKEKAPNSSNSLLKLSGLMRYIITDTHKNIVPLEKEIACINDFIDLQRLRLTDHVQLTYIVNGNVSGHQIAPMLLIPFIENAFKHGVSPDEDSSIHITIDIDDDILKMDVRNNKVSVNNDTIGKSGLGMKNAKSRLQLLYPSAHSLEITENAHSFHVLLKLFF